MALITMNYLSKTLGMHQTLNVILPEDSSYFNSKDDAKALKALFILHGLSSDTSSYIRYTNVERYANEHQLAIIMPNADHSFYTNMAYGHSYYNYIIELYHYVHQILPLSKQREDNFIAGHSMGGYGTIKFALTQSQLFSKAAPLSAPFDISMLRAYQWYDFSSESVVGDENKIEGSEFDPYYLIDKAIKDNVNLPELFIMCGTGDELYPSSLDFINYLDENQVKYTFRKSFGKHNYEYWDKAIKQVIEEFTK